MLRIRDNDLKEVTELRKRSILSDDSFTVLKVHCHNTSESGFQQFAEKLLNSLSSIYNRQN